MKLIKTVLSSVALTVAFASQATPVSYSFSGVVTDSFLPSTFALGSSFNGTFSFDSAAIDSNANPSAGYYSNGFSITANVGGITYSNLPNVGGVSVWNGLSNLDRFDANAQGTIGIPSISSTSTIPSTAPFVVRAVFDDPTQSAFSSDALPTSPLNLGNFANDVFQLSFYQGVSQVNVIGKINSLQLISPVPEPETYAMLLAGLGLVGAALKRRKAKQC
jgi:hypothetical protein